MQRQRLQWCFSNKHIIHLVITQVELINMNIIWLENKAGKQILEQYNKKNINELFSLELIPFTEIFQTKASFLFDDDYYSINVSPHLQQVLCEWQF